MAPRIPRQDTNAPQAPLPQYGLLRGRQHLIYDVTASQAEAGNKADDISHVSSNAKWAALALIVKLKGIDYVKHPDNRANMREMMALSNNSRAIAEVAKAMGHRSAEQFDSAAQPLRIVNGWQIKRENDNLVAKKYPEGTRAFFDAYRIALQKEQADLKIKDAKFTEPTGNAQSNLRHGTSEASPMHIAKLAEFLYKQDNGEALKMLLSPDIKPHSGWSYLHGHNKPGNGQLLFAKTGTLSPKDFSKLPAGSKLPEQHKEGVYILTMGYMQDGKPKIAFLRADSDEHRKELAKQFLDSVAKAEPRQAPRTQRTSPTRAV